MKILFLILLFTVAAFGQIESKYDKFKDETTVALPALFVTPTGKNVSDYNHVSLSGSFSFPGSKLTKSKPSIALYISVISNSWQFLEPSLRDLNFLVDHKRFTLNCIKRSGMVHSGQTIEALVYLLSRSQLESIVNGKSAEFQLQSMEVALSGADKNALRDLLNAATVK